MSSASRLLAAALAAACLAAATAAVARADGDPASDFLLSQDVYLPYSSKIPAERETALTELVRDADASGFRIKVALIAAPVDLGAIGVLWRKPQPYARFLGQELRFLYRGRLLIAMPNGYGIYRNGRPVAAERRVLDALPLPEATGTDLATAAAGAVRRLARAQGVTLKAPSTSGGSSENRDRLVIVAVVLALVGVASAAFTVHRLRRRS